MPKLVSTGNRSLTDFFKPRSSEPAVKRPRIDGEGKPPSPSPIPSSSTLANSSAEHGELDEDTNKDANASFASMRSTSSKRITTSSGQKAVTNSDSDTDEALEDLDSLMNRFQARNKKQPATSSSASRTPNVIPKQEPKKKYAFSLSSLVEEQRTQVAMEVRIAEAQANLHEAEKKARTTNIANDKNAIQAALERGDSKDDAGKSRRVMDALERTDAFERHDVWHFFQKEPMKQPTNPFPRLAHANSSLRNTVNDPERRRQAFASGFLPRIAERLPLPDELLSWLMMEMCRERSETLLSAYSLTLVRAARFEAPSFAATTLEECFCLLGTRSEVLSATETMQASQFSVDVRLPSRTTNVVPFVDLLQQICHFLPSESKNALAHFLIRASFDQGILSDLVARTSIEKCLCTLFDTFSPTTILHEAVLRIAKNMFGVLKSPVLQYQLINALPSATAQTHCFRRRLVLAFILDKERYLEADCTNEALLSRILLLFEKNSLLSINKTTDYIELRARLGMLDVALDAGFSDFAFLEKKDKVSEKQFNESIDSLAKTVRDMSAQIVDAGAARMTRTEAKVVAERLVQRLEFAVRTREKLKKDWFGNKERQKKEEFMNGWVGLKQERKADLASSNENQSLQSEKATKNKPNGLVVGGTATPLCHTDRKNGVLKPSSKDDYDEEAMLAQLATISPQKKMAIRMSNSPSPRKGQQLTGL